MQALSGKPRSDLLLNTSSSEVISRLLKSRNTHQRAFEKENIIKFRYVNMYLDRKKAFHLTAFSLFTPYF